MTLSIKPLLAEREKAVKLLVFHSPRDVVRVSNNSAMPTLYKQAKISDWTGPEVIIDPLICPEPGKVLTVADPETARAIRDLHNRNLEAQKKLQEEE